MKKYILFAWVICMFCQCKQKNISPENTLLSPTDLSKILIEVHTLEALVLERNYNLTDSSQLAYQDGEKALFRKLKINYQQYKNSYTYYLRENPKVLDNVYAVVIDSLQKRELKAKLLPTSKIPIDTIQRNRNLPTRPKILNKRERIRRADKPL